MFALNVAAEHATMDVLTRLYGQALSSASESASNPPTRLQHAHRHLAAIPTPAPTRVPTLAEDTSEYDSPPLGFSRKPKARAYR